MKNIILFLSLSLCSQARVSAAETLEPFFLHTDQMMKTYVTAIGEHQSKVEYAKLKEHHGDLDNVVKEYEAVSQDTFKSWSQNKQIAFLIDAYNILTFKLFF